jgi:hypothetical protein
MYVAAMIEILCAECRRPFKTFPRTLRRAKNPTCSQRCNGMARGREWAKHAHKGRAAWGPEAAASHKLKMSGPRNPAWKGGVTLMDKHGTYGKIKYVRCPPELLPMARKDGYVMEHRLVMARMVGRPLTRTEVVHHRDHNPRNNAPENLELWPDNRLHKLAEHGRPVWDAENRLSLTA